MLKENRAEAMLALIQLKQKATVRELAEHFDVSDETVRRDLVELQKMYPLKKVHGGIMLLPTAQKEAAYEVRKLINREQKQAIAEQAAAMLCDEDVIAIDIGSAAEAFASRIFGKKDLIIFTVSLSFATILSRKLKDGDFTGTVVLPGGTLNPSNGTVGGSDIFPIVKGYKFDKFFFGATGFSAEGIKDWNPEEGAVSRAILERSAHNICLAESSKFTKDSFYTITGYDAVRTLITDDGNEIPDTIAAALADSGTIVIRASGFAGKKF